MAAASTVVDLVREALSGPDRPVLRERNGDGAWRTATARDLERRSGAVASALRGRGLQPGDRVAICAPNRIDWIVCRTLEFYSPAA